MNQEEVINEKAFAKFCFLGVSHKGLGRRPLSPQQESIYNLARVGWGVKSISKRLGITLASVYDGLHKIKWAGWDIHEPIDRSHGQ